MTENTTDRCGIAPSSAGARIIITQVAQSPGGHALFTWKLQRGSTCLYQDKVRRGRSSVETRIRIFQAAAWKILSETPGGKFKWSLPSPFGGEPVVKSTKGYRTAIEAMEAFADLVAGFDHASIEEIGPENDRR